MQGHLRKIGFCHMCTFHSSSHIMSRLSHTTSKSQAVHKYVLDKTRHQTSLELSMPYTKYEDKTRHQTNLELSICGIRRSLVAMGLWLEKTCSAGTGQRLLWLCRPMREWQFLPQWLHLKVVSAGRVCWLFLRLTLSSSDASCNFLFRAAQVAI